MDFSQISSTFDTLRITPPAKLTLLDAHIFTPLHYPPMPPDADTLILNIHSQELALQIKKVLLAVYPKEHEIYLVEGQMSKVEQLGNLQPFDKLRATPAIFYIPSLGEGTSFESFAEITAHLRAPDGCPWDKEQTHQTLRKHLLEESYETISAMDSNSTTEMREEFGDLLLQIVLNSQIASESNEFNATQVIKHIYDKIIRRHPHVFGDLKLDGVEGVLANWEKLKEKERGGKKESKGILDGVPISLPALSQAQEYQDRAARVGFDWKEIDGVLDKIKEEIEEIKNAESDFELASEIGDLFFVLVNFARWKYVDAESALRGTNLKFKKRFAYVEKQAKNGNKKLTDLSLEEIDAFWNEAKAKGL
ncbi:MAG: nucleoside triphosphate pyrophosphohydrolase [Anaerolineales bacterium]|nr:nucleoside triphosphate pyrophosphohydrolase [Anaerolineales bacterium]